MGDPHVHEFFRLLSLCHTVMSEEKNEGECRAGLCSRLPDSGLQAWGLLCTATAPGLPGWDTGLRGWPLTPRVSFLLPRGAVLQSPVPG